MAKANPKATAYEKHKGRTAALQRKKSAAGRDIGSIPPVREPERRHVCSLDFRQHCLTYHAPLFTRPFCSVHDQLIAFVEHVVFVGRLKAWRICTGRYSF